MLNQLQCTVYGPVLSIFKTLAFHISIRSKFPGREVICTSFFDIQIVNDYVYKSTSADS